MDTPADLRRYRDNFQDETDSAALYRAMADGESKPELAEIYRRLASVEEGHADFWRRRLIAAGGPAPSGRPGWRTRILIACARYLGSTAVLPTVMGQETRNRDVYDTQPEADHTTLPAQERSHARVLALLAGRKPGAWDGNAYARLEGRHGAGGGNTLRAAVLGANDGLVSTFSLVMGVLGAALSADAILTTALAGILAGAGSMAMGEWISVQSSRELYEKQIATEADELAHAPAEELEELVLIYQAKGFSPKEARTLAERVIQDQATALDTLVREELGINPDDLGGSAWAAALSSFLVFVLGALVPVLPVLFAPPHLMLAAVLASSAAGLFLIGAAITVFTGKNLFRSGLRQLLIGLAAAGVTYGAGRLFGVGLGSF